MFLVLFVSVSTNLAKKNLMLLLISRNFAFKVLPPLQYVNLYSRPCLNYFVVSIINNSHRPSKLFVAVLDSMLAVAKREKIFECDHNAGLGTYFSNLVLTTAASNLKLIPVKVSRFFTSSKISLKDN